MSDTDFEDDVDDVVLDEQDEGQQEEQESSEDKARRLGWKPKEEYKGKGEWTDAEAFLERTENDPQALKKSLRTIERNYSKLEKTTEAILQHQQRQLEDARKQGYSQAKADLQARLDDAIESGDKEQARKIIKSKEALEERERQDEYVKPDTNQDDKVVKSWLEKNVWYNSDPRMRAAAKQIEHELALEGVPLEDRLEQTTKLIMEDFPHKFGKKRAPSMLGGGNNTNKARPKAGTYEALTSEARAECDRSVKGSNGKISKEDWLRYATPDMFV
jgi:hypothetical protein